MEGLGQRQKEEKEIGPSPMAQAIAIHTQVKVKAQIQLLCTPSKPNCQAQSKLGPQNIQSPTEMGTHHIQITDK
jgi:hypothetical protein